MLRPEQLEDQVHFMLSTLIQRELRDPDLGFLTLTAVRLTGDRSIARVYYTVLGEEAQVERSRKARRVPELQFFPDSTLEQGNKIEAIFAQIKEEEAARPALPDDQEPA